MQCGLAADLGHLAKCLPLRSSKLRREMLASATKAWKKPSQTELADGRTPRQIACRGSLWAVCLRVEESRGVLGLDSGESRQGAQQQLCGVQHAP